MSGSARVDLGVGARVLVSTGPALVAAIERHGVQLRDVDMREWHVPWSELAPQPIVDGEPQAGHSSLEPWWSSLDESARAEALVRMEVVLEILTGYRYGLRELAQPGEPFVPFGPGFGVSERQRVQAMGGAWRGSGASL